MQRDMELDDTDIKLLNALQENARLTVKELGAKINLSTTPTFERQKRLEREGVIEKYVAVVNPEKAGNHLLVLCNIRLKQHSMQYIQTFMDAARRIPEIVECYNTSGEFDFLIKVYARDMHHYQDFMLNTLGRIDCVGSLNSIFVIDQTKSTRGVPIQNA